MTLESQESRRRELASAVRRLRVAATSDPRRGDELADALVELTANRLLAWDFTDAATDAPESVVLAARILASRGPSGPYASVPDAVRYVSATAQLAAVQAGLGQAEAAGRTLDGLDAWRQQVSRLPLAENLPDAVAIWALLARARAALTGDAALANACADAAELRLFADPRPPAYLAVAVHLLTADCRWAAGQVESALAHHRLALDAHSGAVAGLSRHPRPGVAKIALAPVPALYEPYAQRLAATGDPTAGIAVRRAEVAMLELVSGTGAADTARAGLAEALAAVGRTEEAATHRAGDALAGTERLDAPTPGERIAWTALPSTTALTTDAAAAQARPRWQQAERDALAAGAAQSARAQRDEAELRVRAEADAAERARERAQTEQRSAAAAAAALAEREAAELRESEWAAERARQDEAAARAAADERRRQLAEAHRRDVDPDAARRAAEDLERARDAVRGAGDDLARAAAAYEHLGEVLRPLAVADPSHTQELVATLEALVGLRWRLGDAAGSRAAAREARTLGG